MVDASCPENSHHVFTITNFTASTCLSMPSPTSLSDRVAPAAPCCSIIRRIYICVTAVFISQPVLMRAAWKVYECVISDILLVTNPAWHLQHNIPVAVKEEGKLIDYITMRISRYMDSLYLSSASRCLLFFWADTVKVFDSSGQFKVKTGILK